MSYFCRFKIIKIFWFNRDIFSFLMMDLASGANNTHAKSKRRTIEFTFFKGNTITWRISLRI